MIPPILPGARKTPILAVVSLIGLLAVALATPATTGAGADGRLPSAQAGSGSPPVPVPP